MCPYQRHTHKWKVPVRILVLDIIKKEKRIKRSEIYKKIKTNERTVRAAVDDLLTENLVVSEPCECGHTSFLELA